MNDTSTATHRHTHHGGWGSSYRCTLAIGWREPHFFLLCMVKAHGWVVMCVHESYMNEANNNTMHVYTNTTTHIYTYSPPEVGETLHERFGAAARLPMPESARALFAAQPNYTVVVETEEMCIVWCHTIHMATWQRVRRKIKPDHQQHPKPFWY